MSVNDDAFDEELDYEMDEDPRGAELLELDEEPRECKLVQQMSLVSVTPSDTLPIVPPPIATQESSLEVKELGNSSAPVLPEVTVTSLCPPNFQSSVDFWPRSLQTYNKLMNTGSTTQVDEALEPQKLKTDAMEPVQVELLEIRNDIIEPEEVKSAMIEEKHVNDNVMELDAPLISLDDILDTEDTDEMSGSVHISSQKNRSTESKSMMSMNLFENTSNGVSNSIQHFTNNSTKMIFKPTLLPPKKSMFIIQAQQNGGLRKVMIDPALDDVLRQGESFKPIVTDLRQRVLNKRKPPSAESRPKNKEKVCYSDLDLFESSSTNTGDEELPMDAQSEDEEKNLMEKEKLKELTTQIQYETDEEKKYLLQIEKQKMERVLLIRQKEMKRKLEGWRFQ